eukprot:TRINITY_DN4633_c0_g1_i1.p1 TRINITY_DN4633_c0_g1~~TRINITY_DN4633_c0_g1_i1.p1  ORF type:complete len:558 (+),score=88.19 TRINITY_DN4633_c0_g1_i1:373-2046(+)
MLQSTGCPRWQVLPPPPGYAARLYISALSSQIAPSELLRNSHVGCTLRGLTRRWGCTHPSQTSKSALKLQDVPRVGGYHGSFTPGGLVVSSKQLRVRWICRAGSTRGLDFVKTIETDSLPPSVRESTMLAIDDLGRRVTIGDVASRSGLKVTQAQSALQALAADSGGFLEVSDEGDVLYCFPKDYRSNLSAKSLKIRLEPAVQKLQEVGSYVVRVTFGTTLLASIVLVYSAIVILISSARSDDDNRSNRGYGSQRSSGPGFTMFISPADLFWYWDPYYYRRRRTKSTGLNFFESVFSFVFGDEDPNEGLEDRRWKAIGQLITSKGGVVTAEELAPYLDVRPMGFDAQDDDSYVLPVLLQFDGQPEVDNKGNIIYRFPTLQRSAVDWLGAKGYFTENRVDFSKSTTVERAMVIGLGGVNLVGVIILSSMLKDYSLLGQLGGAGFIPFVSKVLPFLQAYTAAFFAIPAFRWMFLQRKNQQIEERNRARLERAIALDRPTPALLQKLKSARESSKRTIIGSERIIYSTDKDISEQNLETQEWERQLRERQARQARQAESN